MAVFLGISFENFLIGFVIMLVIAFIFIWLSSNSYEEQIKKTKWADPKEIDTQHKKEGKT